MNNAGSRETNTDSERSSHELDTETYDAEPVGKAIYRYINPHFVENPSSQVDKEEEVPTLSPHWSLNVELSTIPAAATYSAKALTKNNAQNRNSTFRKISIFEMGLDRSEPEEWKNFRLPAKSSLLTLVQKLTRDGRRTDTKVQVGDQYFDCYISVLQAHSDWFKELSFQVYVKVPEERVTPFAFGKIYNWMLNGEVVAPGNTILDILSAAFYLRISNLITECWEWIDDATEFKEETAVMMFIQARNNDIDEIKKPLMLRICKFFLTLVASRDFLKLEVGEVCALLNSSSIGVNTEVEVLLAAVRWLNHDWNSREPYVFKLAKCVRFCLFPTWYLACMNLKADCPEVQRVVAHKYIRKCILDGLGYRCITKEHSYTTQMELVQALGAHNLELPKKRLIIYDKHCCYHRRGQSDKLEFVTYDMFNDYLKFIQSSDKHYWSTLEVLRDELELEV